MSHHMERDDTELPDSCSFSGLDLDYLDFELFWSADTETSNANAAELARVDSPSSGRSNPGLFGPFEPDEHEHEIPPDLQLRDWPVETERRAPINGSRGPLEILIYEEDVRTERRLERILTSLRCRVIVAPTRQRALQYISSGVSFDLIFAGRERRSGELARSIQTASPGNSSTPILAVAAAPYVYHELQDFDSILELPLSRAKVEDAINVFYSHSILVGPQTKDEPDSDCSWTAADDQEDWQFDFKRHLRRFRAQNDRVSLITPPLLSKQRRKIHAMAHQYRLSHTSLGCGRYKRVLILKCQLLKPSSSLSHWNPGRSQWSEGIVDPRIISFKGILDGISTDTVSSWLAQTKLPRPTLISGEKDQLLSTEETIHILFEDALDAAIVLESVHGTSPAWSSSVVKCDYTLFKDCPWSPWQIPPNLNKIINEKLDAVAQQQLEFASRTRFKTERHSLSAFSDSENDTISESELSDTNTYGQSTASTRYTAPTTNRSSASFVTHATSVTSHSHSHHPGLKPAAASIHSTAPTTSSHQPPTTTLLPPAEYTSDDQSTTPSTKRRRLPCNPSGYTCSFTPCTKTFSHAGDCRKHEKIHESRTHECEICGKRFLYPKDVRRHCQNVHKWKEALMAQRAVRRVR